LLAGDYGGGTFKLVLSEPSFHSPNGLGSGFVIGEFPAKDSYENLQTAFGIYKVSFFLLLSIFFLSFLFSFVPFRYFEIK